MKALIHNSKREGSIDANDDMDTHVQLEEYNSREADIQRIGTDEKKEDMQ